MFSVNCIMFIFRTGGLSVYWWNCLKNKHRSHVFEKGRFYPAKNVKAFGLHRL